MTQLQNPIDAKSTEALLRSMAAISIRNCRRIIPMDRPMLLMEVSTLALVMRELCMTRSYEQVRRCIRGFYRARY